MPEQHLSDICKQILDLDEFIRFVGIANKMGSLEATTFRQGGVRDAGLLGEERVTLEPYPGFGLKPNEIDPTSVLGKKGIGLDGNEVEGTILIHSNEIGDEKANVYLYQLDEQNII